MSNAKVLMGLPVYNGELYLQSALDAHLNQTFTDFKLVISDNGSTDATQEICERYARLDSRIVYLRSDVNRGILWNHARVFDAIETPEQYFRWAAADDIPGPAMIEHLVRLLDADAGVVGAVPDTHNIDGNGVHIGVMPRTLDMHSNDVVERARMVLLGTYQMVIAFGLFRAATLQAMRTRCVYLGWDFVFLWELALLGRISQTEGPILLRRFHEGSISRVKSRKGVRSWVEPNAGFGAQFPHWKWAYERWRVLARTPMSGGERAQVAKLLGKVTIWERGSLSNDVVQAVRHALRLTDDYTF